jgi:hypothetical protein
MPERPFQCTPTAWNRDPILNSVSWEAEFLFRRIALECDRYWRIAVDAENMAHSIRCRAFESQRRYRAWALPKVARYLNELQAAGIVQRLVQGERCWLEVGEWLQYAKGSGATSEPECAVQPELNLPATLFALPPATAPPSQSNERRVEGEKDKTSTRAVRGEQELLDQLAAILPPSEMLKNGGMWRKRIRHNARAVSYAIEDWKVRTPDQRRTIKNIGAWLTDRHMRALLEFPSRNGEEVKKIV